MKGGKVRIQDKGRGIPVGPHNKWKNPDGTPMNTLTGILTKLHAGKQNCWLKTLLIERLIFNY